MIRCECGAFVPSSCCPECGTLVRKRKRFRNAALSAISVITLAACYGAPYPEPEHATEPVCEDTSQDLDGDGWCMQHDSDEANPDVH